MISYSAASLILLCAVSFHGACQSEAVFFLGLDDRRCCPSVSIRVASPSAAARPGLLPAALCVGVMVPCGRGSSSRFGTSFLVLGGGVREEPARSAAAACGLRGGNHLPERRDCALKPFLPAEGMPMREDWPLRAPDWPSSSACAAPRDRRSCRVMAMPTDLSSASDGCTPTECVDTTSRPPSRLYAGRFERY